MKEFSVPMALVDYLPVVLFLLACQVIEKDCRKRLANPFGWMFRVGTLLVFAAGFLKATYKLFYALGVGDFAWMSRQFFSNQAFGFLLAGTGLVVCLTKEKKNTAYSLLPTMALVGLMIVGLGAMDAALCYASSMLKKKSALICFIVSFFLILCMGYLSSKDFAQAAMNWLAQGINVAGQGLLYLGCRQLHQAGLSEY